MKNRTARVFAVAAALAAAVTVLTPASSASAVALDPTDPPQTTPNFSISPTSGDFDDPFTLNFATQAACPTSPAVPGGPHPVPEDILVHTFLAPASAGPTAVAGATFNGFGIVTDPPATIFPLVNASVPVTNRNVDNAGSITGTFAASLGGGGFYPAGTFPDGAYNIGIACMGPDFKTHRYWQLPITITNDSYVFGAVPGAPGGLTLTPASGQITVSFDEVTDAVPPVLATNGYEITVIGLGAPAPFTVDDGSPVVVSGLTNGEEYQVEVRAESEAGQGLPASASVTVDVGAQPAGQFTASPGTETCTVTFTPHPSATGTLDSVDFTGDPGSLAANVAAPGPFTHSFTGLTAGTPYTFTATPNYAAPDNGSSQTATCVPQGEAFVVQQVSVVRPPGALILTQRCGVYGELPADPNTNAFPGYPVDLGAEVANNVDPGGAPATAPLGIDRDPVTNPLGAFDDPPALGTDGQFWSYPNPAPPTYPTYCGLELGVAALETEGDLAGFYYADGRLNEVTVLDTRDDNAGWTAQGTMGDFNDGFAGPDFDGNYAGWVPRVNNVTGVDERGTVTGGVFAADPDGDALRGTTVANTQIVAAGPEIDPGSGVGVGGAGLGDGAVLAEAAEDEGLGVAELDARFKLLIPPGVDAATYTGNLQLDLF